LLAAQRRPVPLRDGFLDAQVVKAPAFCGNDEFRLAQPRAQCIALLELVTEAIRQRADARSYGGEFGFRPGGIRGFCRRRR
jgi:hypothetical protein